MKFSFSHFFRLVAWCALVSLGISLSNESVTFLVAVGLAFLTTPLVMWGTTYATPESWFLTVVLNTCLVFVIGLSSKWMFSLAIPTYVQIGAATFLFCGAISATVNGKPNQKAKTHFRELLVPSALGFACICFAPIVAFPGGKIPGLLFLACILGWGTLTLLYTQLIQNVTKHVV